MKTIINLHDGKVLVAFSCVCYYREMSSSHSVARARINVEIRGEEYKFVRYQCMSS